VLLGGGVQLLGIAAQHQRAGQGAEQQRQAGDDGEPRAQAPGLGE
jgi:hypothetical protein